MMKRRWRRWGKEWECRRTRGASKGDGERSGKGECEIKKRRR